MQPTRSSNAIPSTLQHPAALRFWTAVASTGILAGISAGLLTRLLELIQRGLWGGDGTNILWAAQHTSAGHCFLILLAAGAVTGLGQLVLKRLASGNSIDTTAAIWFYAGRLPRLRTLGSAVLSIIVVGMGASLGREGAPKQAAAVFANWISDIARLSEEQRRLLVSCGAGAGMAGAYSAPLGSALFSLEVLRGVLALRYILPALFCSIVATAVAWIMLPNAATYSVPSYPTTSLGIGFAVVCGLVAGPFSVLYVRLVTWAERNKPTKWQRVVAPIAGLALLGIVAVKFPQLAGNGKDASELIFTGAMPMGLTAALLVLKPAAILLCVRCGVPGGLFTPSLTSGALLGSTIGFLGAMVLPHVPVGLCGIIGAGAVLAATTQGPLSSVVLLLELTGRDRSFILPLLLAATIATLIARSIEPRSIYDARLTDEEIRVRHRVRDKAQLGPELSRD